MQTITIAPPLAAIAEESLEDFAGLARVPIHAVLSDGTIGWANESELDFLGYSEEQYIGHKIQDFHLDPPVIAAILGVLSDPSGDGIDAYPARLRAKDGSTKYVLISSNVHWRKGEFISTRCFSMGVSEAIYRAAKAALPQ
jgi:PAS domain S-box-containing protein